MSAKVLVLDIETSPIEAYVWGIWEQNVGLNQIKKDWQIISFAAKWLNQKKVLQSDLRNRSEENLIKDLHKLLNDADIVVTQNGKSFDVKKINAKILEYHLTPPKPFQQIDTRVLAKKHFGFTSNKLEYMTEKFNTKYKKLKHSKFPGQELWTECLKGNHKAWKEMALYNKHDVLSTEELYKKLIPWDSSVNFGVYQDFSGEVPTCICGSKSVKKHGTIHTTKGRRQRYECKICARSVKTGGNLKNHPDFTPYKDLCSCGHKEFKKDGYSFTKIGKFQRYMCLSCGTTKRGRENLLKGKVRTA